jgi:hypothetical protein
MKGRTHVVGIFSGQEERLLAWRSPSALQHSENQASFSRFNQTKAVK